MENLNELLVVLGGILLRLGIPILVTLGLWRLLKKLDERWQADANQRRTALVSSGALPGNVGCWEINQCTPENYRQCKAYQNKETPCWQVFRSQNGQMQEKCIGCQVFQKAPTPVIAR